MVKKEILDEIKKDSKDFAYTFGSYYELANSETNLISDHVFNQAVSSDYEKNRELVKGPHGFEPILTIKGKGILIQKRVFHTSHAETITGADFVLTKRKGDKEFEIAIQAKRNGNKPSFSFDKRDQDQLDRFSRWFPNGYYMFVDETGDVPRHCFVRIVELRRILDQIGDKKSISNNLIHQYCRGTNVFYDAFYKCRRGSMITEENLVFNVEEYVKESDRVVVELFAKQEVRLTSKKRPKRF